MTTTIHTSKRNGDGYELTKRGDGLFMLRTWAGRHNRVRTVPIYLNLTDLEGLFDAIGQELVADGFSRLDKIMEAL